ncbi:SGNH/GDSL hydrolase family protein [Kitasatospora sp. NBC_01250]|uniref:SGNH/GDSL hydrolase family protein n=1 Tax=unclassified Kitasatospora TaxID=2633591 RepID=UPI002E0D6639|nr:MULTISPECIES: SGNH/GDSL hydrolase family protein [unclassified Kitasatospora]WSJ66302.1 SGNH/GDSL hydrolase family protein [Kitasatospora sp. NBC_01302]
MRPVRVVSGAAVASLFAAGTLFFAGPASAAGVNYVALGDSYSAGVGAGNYDSSSGSCSRSYDAYPELWDAANSPASFSFVACSGAKTGDVLNTQLSAVNSSTTLISLTIGGNDAGFTNTMETCVLDGTSACQSAVATAESYAQNTLPGQLGNLYQAIRAKAPGAEVVVVGYPHLYEVPGSCWFGISDTSRTAINGAADALDGVIAKAAANAGFTFADVRSAFTGHEICSDDEWLHSTTLPIDESYHPTADGQSQGYLPVFSGAV